MSQFVEGFKKTLVAGASLVGKEFYIGKVNSTGDLLVAAGAAELLVGIIRTEAASGEAAAYQFLGTAKVKLGGTVAVGDFITSNASGKGITTITDGNRTIGMALEAGVADDIVEVQLMLGWFHNG